MNNDPKITVITANYNQGIFLETTIRSVLDQNYPNIEYIIIDGLSKDNSVEVIQQYADKLSYWVSEKDAGQTDAINKGIQRATGEIITWLNADDYFLPGALQHAANLYKETHYDFFLGNSIFVDVNGNRLNEQFKSSLIDNHIFIPCDTRCRVHQPSSFFSKKIIDQTGLLDTKLHYAMDVDFWMKIMAYKGRMVYRDIDLTYFRRHEDAKSARGNLPFIEDTLNSAFFKRELQNIHPEYYAKSKQSIYTCYFDTLLMEHKTGKVFSFSIRMFFMKPFYTIKKILAYIALKFKLKFNRKRK